MGTLHAEDIGNATGIFNLMRNIGGSIGISMTTTMLARMSQTHQAILVSHLTPYDPNYQHTLQIAQSLVLRTGAGITSLLPHQLIYNELLRQSLLMAYIDNFRWLGILCLFCIPTVLLFRKVEFKLGSPPASH